MLSSNLSAMLPVVPVKACIQCRSIDERAKANFRNFALLKPFYEGEQPSFTILGLSQ
jgi:hypothetical protein